MALEYTFLEKPEPVRIPFEAQVDIGVAKAGPVEAVEGGKAPQSHWRRIWPPPRQDPVEALPPPRAAFNPDAGSQAAAAKAAPAKLDKATVDLFSITVAKPAPSEVKGVEWNTPPSPVFYASGFTIARLLLSTPGASIVSVPPDGITVTRFEDNKGGQLDTTLYRETSASSDPSSPTQPCRSPDGEQLLLNLSLASAHDAGSDPLHPDGERPGQGHPRGTHRRHREAGTAERRGFRRRAIPKGRSPSGRRPFLPPPPRTPGNMRPGFWYPVLWLRWLGRMPRQQWNAVGRATHNPAEGLNEGPIMSPWASAYSFPRRPSGPVTLRIRYCEAVVDGPGPLRHQHGHRLVTVMEGRCNGAVGASGKRRFAADTGP